jgi:hypothetical protein
MKTEMLGRAKRVSKKTGLDIQWAFHISQSKRGMWASKNVRTVNLNKSVVLWVQEDK